MAIFNPLFFNFQGPGLSGKGKTDMLLLLTESFGTLLMSPGRPKLQPTKTGRNSRWSFETALTLIGHYHHLNNFTVFFKSHDVEILNTGKCTGPLMKNSVCCCSVGTFCTGTGNYKDTLQHNTVETPTNG